MKVLRKEAEDRGISPNGKKIVLVERLRQADEKAKRDAEKPANAALPAAAAAPTSPEDTQTKAAPATAALAEDPPQQSRVAVEQPPSGAVPVLDTAAVHKHTETGVHHSRGFASQQNPDSSVKASPGRPKPVHPSDYFKEPSVRPPASAASAEAPSAAPAAPASLNAADVRQQSRQRQKHKKYSDNLVPELDAATEATGLAVTWLGTSSGAPTNRRNVSSIALRTPAHTCLVDCGEGTLRQMQAGCIDPARVTHICISHMHGDHCFGLPGMVHDVSKARAARGSTTEPLFVFGPPGLHLLLESSTGFAPRPLSMPLTAYEFTVQPQRSFRPKPMQALGSNVHFGCLAPDRTPQAARALKQLSEFSSPRTDMHEMHEVPVVPGLVWSMPGPAGLRITAAQLQHRVPCWGYVFQEEGSTEAEGRKVVLLGDTAGSHAMLEPGMGADLLSHEATFSMDMAGKARIAQHSTARDAGRFAAALQARNLVLTHFSNRYSFEGNRPSGGQLLDATSGDITMLCREAFSAYRNRNIFAANDLYTFKVPHRRPAAVDRPSQEQRSLTGACL